MRKTALDSSPITQGHWHFIVALVSCLLTVRTNAAVTNAASAAIVPSLPLLAVQATAPVSAFNRLWELKDYRNRYVRRRDMLRDREFSLKTISGMIDPNADVSGDAVERNATRWPTTGEGYPDRLNFAQDLEKWVEARLDWLDEKIHKRFGPIP